MNEKESRKSTIICVCGMAGSGKSTLAKRLAEKYSCRYFSGGDALKELAIEEGYRDVKCGWWESKEGLSFLERRSKDQKFDETIDRKLLGFAEKGNVIFDSWTMPWLLKIGFKIWLEASLGNRAKRIAKRDNMEVEEALKALRSKEEQTRKIYKRLYGFDLGKDYEPFHLILDTDNLEADEVFEVLCAVIDGCVLHFKSEKP